jgi:hypothetical protein
MVVAQQFPRRTVLIRAIRAHRLHHHADQLISELIGVAVAIQRPPPARPYTGAR